jgi:hypothetical protein
MYAILMAKVKSLQQIQDDIRAIKSQLQNIGDMRPGSLTTQYRNRKERTGAFYQISYTYKMKSKTEYVRPEFVEQISQQIQNYKEFKKLIEEWVALGIQYSQLSMKSEIKQRQLYEGDTTRRKRKR